MASDGSRNLQVTTPARVGVLEYEDDSVRKARRRRLVRWARRLVLATMVLAVLGAGWWQREWISDWVGWQLAMRAAWRHEMPEAGFLVASGEKGQHLAASNPDYVLDDRGVATYYPGSLRRLLDYDWRFRNIEDPMFGRTPRIIFLGALRRPDGGERLVAVAGDGPTNTLRLLAHLDVAVVAPPSLLGEERFAGTTMWGRNLSGRLEFATLHMAQRDPDNSCRVLIPFTAYGHERNQVVGRGLIALDLGDDDALHASMLEVEMDEAWGPAGLGIERLSMPKHSLSSLKTSPWRTATIRAAQSFQSCFQEPAVNW